MKTQTGRIYRQKKRRSGDVRRIEIVLNPAYAEDHQIIDCLDSLPRGDKSDFIRDALLIAVMRDKIGIGAEPKSETPDIRRLLEEIRDKITNMPIQRLPAGTTNSPDHAMASASGGIDMSVSRRRKAPSRTPPAPQPVICDPAFDAEDSRKILLEGVLSYGNDKTM